MIRVLFLDDMEERYDHILNLYEGSPLFFVYASNYQEAQSALEADLDFELVCLDHDLCHEDILCSPLEDTNEKTGSDLCWWIIDHHDPDDFPDVLIHSHNPAGAWNMLKILTEAGFSARYVPFSNITSNTIKVTT